VALLLQNMSDEVSNQRTTSGGATIDTTETDLDVQRKYQPLFELGRGGAAVVRAAVARGIGGFSKIVVLKTIRDAGAGGDDREAVRTFVNEARLSARMNHPNVVQVYEVYRENRLPVIVMEYLDGQSLSKFQARAIDDPDYTVEMAVTILCRVLAGLHYAHTLTDYDGSSLSIVHRDVSPQNVMITYDGQVKLLDFGIAKLNTGGSHETRTGVIKGKIGYMAPEQLEGGQIDCRADVFAVGVMLWEAISQQRLWGDRSEMEIVRSLACADIPPLSSRLVERDAELARICHKAMDPSPDERYASAAAFQADLEQFLQRRGTAVSQQQIGELISRLCADLRHEAQERLRPELAKFAANSPDWDSSLQEFERALSVDPPASRRRSRWLIPVVGTVVLGLGAMAYAAFAPGPASAPVLAAPPPPVVSAPAPEKAPEPPPQPEPPRQVRLRVDATPAGAQLYLDGELLGEAPIDRSVLADTRPHELVARASGHADTVRTLNLASDVIISLSLTPVPAAAPARTPAPSVRRPPPPPRRPTPAAPPRANAEPSAPAPKAPAASCTPPYYIGTDGLRHFRPECL
jgi:eukaryotic-like serine/threonine-protein kinase